SYETRLTKTAQVIKDQIQLDHYLNPPVTGKFQEFGFFLRPPKPLAPAKQFQLTDLTSGQFLGQYDVDGSFLDLGKNEKGDAPKLSLHFLGRRKLAKKADPKKKTTAPSPAETAQRGPFVQDVQGLLGFVFGNAAQGATKDYSKGTNKYKRQIFPATEKTNIRVYYLAEKAGADTYDAALIWEVPNPPVQAMEKGIDLTLGSFAAGAKATRAFQGDTPAEDAPGEGGEAPAGPSAPF
ncbi:MAG TPA: hypothetical protein VF590_19740, partial [Isosphaeraceae bacterium]